MYTVIKSKKHCVDHQKQCSVSHCCFLNNNHLFVLFENNDFIVVNHSIQHNQGEEQQNIQNSGSLNSYLESEQNNAICQNHRLKIVVDCKRIEQNVCLMITKNCQQLLYFEFNQLQNTFVIKNMIQSIGDILQTINLIIFTHIYALQDDCFFISNHIPDDKIVYFSAFNQIHHQHKDFTSIYQENIQHLPLLSTKQIVKPLCLNKQLAIYQNIAQSQVDWQVAFISSCCENSVKKIVFPEDMNEKFMMVDILETEINQYLAFFYKITKNNGNELNQNERKLIIYSCKLYKQGNGFVQKVEVSTTFLYDNACFLDILEVNHKGGYFIAKSYAHEEYDHEIYENFIEVVDLQSGTVIEKAYCTLKNTSMSPNGRYLLDYRQEFDDDSQQFYFHIRLLLAKKNLYLFLLENGSELEGEKLRVEFRECILNML